MIIALTFLTATECFRSCQTTRWEAVSERRSGWVYGLSARLRAARPPLAVSYGRLLAKQNGRVAERQPAFEGVAERRICYIGIMDFNHFGDTLGLVD